MARTTSEQVEALLDNEVEDDFDMEPFIDTASQLLDDAIERVEADYTDAKAELIERWLAAHFYSIPRPRTTAEEIRGGGAGISERFEGRTALALNHTRYGQQAMLLDTAGGLAILNAQATTNKKIIRPSITHLAIPRDPYTGEELE